MIDHSIKTVEFKGASIQVVQLHLRSLDIRKLEAGFKQTLGASPDFFDGELAGRIWTPLKTGRANRNGRASAHYAPSTDCTSLP